MPQPPNNEIHITIDDDYTLECNEDSKARLCEISTEIDDTDFNLLHEELDIKEEEDLTNNDECEPLSPSQDSIEQEPVHPQSERICNRTNSQEKKPMFHYVTCPKCNFVLRNYNHLVKDLQCNDPEECQQCVFMTDDAYWPLRKHFLEKHPELIRSSNVNIEQLPGLQKCAFCKFATRFEALLELHRTVNICSKCAFSGSCLMKSRHKCSDMLVALKETQRRHDYSLSYNSDSPQCHLCYFNHSDPEIMRMHREDSLHPEFQCSRCGLRVPKRHNMLRHTCFVIDCGHITEYISNLSTIRCCLLKTKGARQHLATKRIMKFNARNSPFPSLKELKEDKCNNGGVMVIQYQAAEI